MDINFSASSDWNNYRKFGFYSGLNLANAPIASVWAFVSVFPQNGNPDYCIQICNTITSNTLFIRYYAAPNWSAWEQLH